MTQLNNLAKASFQLIAEGADYEAALEQVDAPAFKPFERGPPLAFLHIPKTAGASAIFALESYFDDADIAPSRNPPDFAILPRPGSAYRLFRGHYLGGESGFLPSDSDVFTIVRDPVEIVVSMYHYLRQYRPSHWETSWAQQPLGEELRGDDASYREQAEEMANLCRDHSLISLLTTPETKSWRVFRSIILNALGGSYETLRRTVSLEATAPGLKALFAQMHATATSTLENALLVGEQGDLDASLLRLAYLRKWPAPPHLPRIHAFGENTVDEAQCPNLRRVVEAFSPDDFSLYESAREIARGQRECIDSRLGGPPCAESVNQRYRDQFFASAPVTFGFDRHASKAWSGYGWGVREHADGVIAGRQIADARSACLLARVPPGDVDYVFQMIIGSAGSAELVQGVTCAIGGAPLTRASVAWLADNTARVQWQIPSDMIRREDGNLDIKILRPQSFEDQHMYVRRVSLVVWPQA